MPSASDFGRSPTGEVITPSEATEILRCSRGSSRTALDGRIDDGNAGWKGRGLWVDNAGDPMLFTEKTFMGYIAHVQMRPDPLAH
jgi:hypothetical protein